MRKSGASSAQSVNKRDLSVSVPTFVAVFLGLGGNPLAHGDVVSENGETFGRQLDEHSAGLSSVMSPITLKLLLMHKVGAVTVTTECTAKESNCPAFLNLVHH